MILKIKNFQSIEDCELIIPEKAFTCIVGPTNIGKSCIRRALECILYNKSEISYIRNGAKSCHVEITFDDGTNLKWSRDKKTANYVVNGESYAKLAGSVPEIITQKGFRELLIGKDRLNVQVANQFENIFLLNETGSRITEVLSNLGNLNKIISANKKCGNDKKNISSKLKFRKEDLTVEKERLSSFTGLDEQKDKIAEIKNIFTQAKELKIKKDKILNLQQKVNISLRKLSEYRKSKNLEIDFLEFNSDKLINIKKLSSKYYHIQQKVSYYQPIGNIFEVTVDLSCDTLNKIKNLYIKMSNIEDKIKFYKDIPSSVENLDLNIDNISKLKNLNIKIDKSKMSLVNLRKDLTLSESKLVELKENQSKILKELKVCPLCDSNVG